MKITTVGIDLAKNVFQVHAVDEQGKVAHRKQLRRDQMTAFFVNLPPCLVGMEACGSAHHWARTLQGFGHTVRLMSPQFVKPYVKGNKNDVADAEAICEAVARPSMRFVPGNEAGPAIGKVFDDLGSLDLHVHDLARVHVHGVQLKDMLGDVQTDDQLAVHGADDLSRIHA